MRSSILIHSNKSTNDFLKNINVYVYENYSNNFYRISDNNYDTNFSRISSDIAGSYLKAFDNSHSA